jgi:hypothetical protein
VLDADGAAVTTAVVTNFSLVKNGSSAALTTETLTHLANGYYTLALTSGNTNTLGNLEVFVNNTAMSMTVFRYNVIAAQVYDSIVSGSDLLQIDIQQLVGSAQDAARILIGANSNHEVQVTGSNHVAADIHELQTGVITAADFAAGAIDANALATDAVTEIQSGLATTTQLTTVEGKIDTIDNFVDTEVAAIKAVTDKLDTTVELDGAVYRFTSNALEQGPSGSSTVIVSPLSALAPERVVGTTISIAVGDLTPISVDVFDADDNPVNLSTQGNLEVCIESRNNTDLQTIAHGSITIGGSGNRRATFTPNAAAVGTVDKHRWSLRTASGKKVLAYGPWVVERVALAD